MGRRETWDIAGQLLDRSHPGDFNQAMMELGAEVCLPRRPKCEACPVRKFCATQGSGVATDKEQRRRRDQACVVALRGGKVALVQRPPGAALMPGLWELPELAAPNGARPWFTVRHSITQTDYRVAVYRATYPPSDGRWVSLDALDRLPITGLTRKVLRHAHTLI